MNLSTIGQIAMNVHDIDRATAFYRDTLGVPFLFAAGAMAFFDCNGTRLMLGLPGGPEYDHPGSILYFKVDDLTRPRFEAEGMGPFRPYGPDRETMGYYQVPASLLEDVDALRPWVAEAIAVARRAKRKR